MEDRELLELAAKAAGEVGEYRTEEIHTSIGWEKISAIHRPDGDGWWNPLTDDGDALRLAVALNLQVTPGTYRGDEASAFRAGYGEAHEYVHYQQDLAAALRRAIVRVAAEIGKRSADPL
ncbi:hypothetical protein ACF8C6_09005 [Pseudomonas sp. zbq_18]|uniref:hypothetical protein n=1 Tax=Pseudomonas sp. zbq_18 TaxID=3367251 RepID=UPI00370CF285